MKAVLHLGTRACQLLLDEVADAEMDALALVVPAEPRLLATRSTGQLTAGDVHALATLVGDRARRRAQAALEHARAEVSGVFAGAGERTLPTLDVVVVATEEPAALATALQARGVTQLLAARPALVLLDEVGCDLRGALDAAGVALVAR